MFLPVGHGTGFLRCGPASVARLQTSTLPVFLNSPNGPARCRDYRHRVRVSMIPRIRERPSEVPNERPALLTVASMTVSVLLEEDFVLAALASALAAFSCSFCQASAFFCCSSAVLAASAAAAACSPLV